MPERLFFTESDEANALIASDPMALLIGFALDQQVSVQKAFSGPLAIRERLGALDVETLAAADLDEVFRRRPAVHRFPGAMAKRVHELVVHIRDHFGGDAARVWTDAADTEQLRANLAGLPGFGEMKIKALGSVLAKRFSRDRRRGADPLASDARRRRLTRRAGGISGGQAGAQGSVERGPEGLTTLAAASARPRRSISAQADHLSPGGSSQPSRIIFLLTNSSAPKRPSSRPNPDRLTPPKGNSAPSAPTALTNTMPASIWSATRSACCSSVVIT